MKLCVFNFCFYFRRTLFLIPVREQLSNKLLTTAGIEPGTRPFQLTISEIGRLCEAYKSICDEKPDYLKYNHREKQSKDNWPDIEINNLETSENITSLREE